MILIVYGKSPIGLLRERKVLGIDPMSELVNPNPEIQEFWRAAKTRGQRQGYHE